MDALFFHDGDPCPCCGEPINLSKSSTIDAVNGLSREMAKQIQKVKIEMLLLSLDSMAIAMGRAEAVGAILPIYFSVYTKYAALLDSLSTEDIYAALIDAELTKYSPCTPPYSVRRQNLIAALGIK